MVGVGVIVLKLEILSVEGNFLEVFWKFEVVIGCNGGRRGVEGCE